MKALIFGFLACLLAVPAFAAITTSIAPVVVVYPLSVNGPTDPEAGGRLALLFATRLTDLGGVTVKPATPGVDRSRYLQAAKAEGADYYVTGYLTPLGDSVSLVSQVVSTYSGIVVWSSTTDIRSYADASGQADLMRDAILRHAGRTMAALDQPATVPQSTPAPSASQKPNEANLTHLFTHKRATPAPAPGATPATNATPSAVANVPAASRPLPTPRPAATRPPPPLPPPVPPAEKGAIVVGITGGATEAEKAYASNALSAAIAKAGLGGTLVTAGTTSDVPSHARELCAANRATAIYGGTLAVKRVSSLFTPTASADFELIRYDCTGSVTARERVQMEGSGRTDTTVAIDRAVAKSLDAALHPKGRRT